MFHIIVKMKFVLLIFFTIMAIVSVVALPKIHHHVPVVPVVAVRPVVVAPAPVAVIRPVVVSPVLGFGKLGHGHGPRRF